MKVHFITPALWPANSTDLIKLAVAVADVD